MEQSNAGRGFFLMAIALMALLGARHHELLLAPNSYFIGDSLDGFRTMCANFFHLRHDADPSHFSGMHYPYGDAPGYADTIPLLSKLVRYFSNGSDQYLLAAWNLSLVFSQWLCGLFLYLVFRELQLPVWFSLLAALGVSGLTPQHDRFAAHYALSYGFVVPLTTWLLLRFGRRPRLHYSLLIGLVPLLANQIHPYLMAMSVFLIVGYLGFRFLHQPSWKNLAWLSSHGLLQVLLPLGFLLYQTVLNDPIADRPAWPWGFTFYKTRLQSILLPIDLPLGEYIDKHYTDLDYVLTETRAYLGAVTILGGLFLLLRSAYRRWWKKERGTLLPASLRYLLWAALVILCYAACLPFVLFGWEWMTDYLGLLRQFRALGRFAWVFFYVANVAVLCGLYQVIQNLSRPGLRNFCYGLVLTVLLIEGVGYLFYEKYELIERPERRDGFSRADNPWLYTIDLDRYQAILPLPYYHIGSENFWINPLGLHLHRSAWASAESGLPNMGSYMGRTSLGQAIKLIELVVEPYRRPLLLDDLPNDKPLLLYLTKAAYEHKGYRYAHLLRGAKQLYEDERIRLLELPLPSFTERVERQQQSFRNEVDTTSAFPQGELLSKDSLLNFFYDSYDAEGAAHHYRGGAKALASREAHLLYDGLPPARAGVERYVMSVWTKVDYDLAGRTRLRVTEYHPGEETPLQTFVVPFYEYIRSVDAGWMLIDIGINMRGEQSALRLEVYNEDLLYGQEFYLDEFQLRPSTARLYRRTAEEVVVNNRWIPRNSSR
ncbi:MAG: hypothetical protein AAFR05_18270 [Bacteroidota bacterium]